MLQMLFPTEAYRMENFPRQVTSDSPKQFCLNTTWLHLTYESLSHFLTIMGQSHANKRVLGNYSLFTLVTHITEEWGWTTWDLLLSSLKLYNYYWPCCTQSNMTAFSEAECRATAAAPGCPWDMPCLPLSCDSSSEVSTTLMWLKGHCSPDWDPVWTLESQQSKHVCLPAPVSINVSSDCLLFVGQPRALHRGPKANTQMSCMAWEVIQLWPSQKNRFCNVLLLKPTPGRNYL